MSCFFFEAVPAWPALGVGNLRMGSQVPQEFLIQCAYYTRLQEIEMATSAMSA